MLVDALFLSNPAALIVAVAVAVAEAILMEVCRRLKRVIEESNE